MSHHHHAGLALSLSCLLHFLSTNPFSLSQACTHTPLMCSSPPPCHPSRVCVLCALWGWTAPSTTVVVKHATHTLVDHCVDGSHHPTLHPPSTLTPFCAFCHHQPPHHPSSPTTTTHHKATVLIHCPLFCLTHTWCGWHVPLWLLSRPVCGVCGWHAHLITSSTHTATTTVALPIATTLWCVCVDGNTCHMAMPYHQPLTCMAWSSRFLHKCVQSSPLPSTLCVCGGLVVGLCWCGHLCECLCVGWLCCFPPHCVSCVPPCPHPSVSPHSLALVLLLVLVVDEGPGGGLAGRTVVDDHTCGHGGWLSATVTHTHTWGWVWTGCGTCVDTRKHGCCGGCRAVW